MSNCNYTQQVTPNTCLGDSLATFNTNFANLDNAICLQPLVVAGKETIVEGITTEQNDNLIRVSTGSSFVYNTTFDCLLSGATNYDLSLQDGTYIKTTTFPYVAALSGIGPIATFSTVAQQSTPPSVTIYWTASGSDYTTIYATNSATSSTNDLGTVGFNGSVTALLSVGEFLYVGGEFTSVGGYDFKKFCVVNPRIGTNTWLKDYLGNRIGDNLGLAGGVVATPWFTQFGQPKMHPLNENGGFGNEGAINAIVQYGNLIIFGGSYKNVSGKNLGRGLTIWNSVTNKVYPFYVNGDVNAITAINGELYVGGDFNYINYGPVSVSDISGQRIYTNGLARITLSLIESFANKSISKPFCDNVRILFYKKAIINSITSAGGICIGGQFKIYNNGNLTCANLALVQTDGTVNPSWQPILNGAVHKLLSTAGGLLYVAGRFSSYLTAAGLDASPRVYEEFTNLMCFNISTIPTAINSWKPYINGPIFNLCAHVDTTDSQYIYCYGNFDEVNGVSVSYIGAVMPANAEEFNNVGEGKTPVNWRIHLDKPLLSTNQALFRYAGSTFVGGTFDKVNGQTRRYLARFNGPYEELSIEASPQLVWNLGAHVCSPGTSLPFDYTNFASVTSYPFKLGKVSKTTFPKEYTNSVFKNVAKGSLLRFFLQRPITPNTTIQTNAHVVGWKVEFP